MLNSRSRHLVAFTLVAFLASCETMAAPLDELIFDVESCYTGNYASADSFVASMRRMPNFQEDMAAGMEHAYARWKQTADCRMFSYKVDGLDVRGFLAMPAGEIDHKLPVVIFNRGGNADTGEIPFRYIIGKLFPLVEAGFVVIGSQYRGASRDGKPHPDRLKDEFGGRDVNDILALLPIIDAMPSADANRIGMWGQSRGGMMAYLAARKSDRFSALITEATPTDMPAELEFRPGMGQVFETWIPDFAKNPASALEERSALYWAEHLPQALPILILHGTADSRVNPGSALKMAQRLQELEHPYRLVMYENGSHALHRGHDEKIREEAIEWFTEKLAGRETATGDSR